jgi:CobQ-like glutamine amidotransferase family enzyme
VHKPETKGEEMDLEQYEKIATDARDEWLRQHFNTESIRDMVTRTLDKRTEEIVAKLTGFNNHFGQWEVDHCNGRAGQTPIGDFIKEIAAEAVATWLHGCMKRLPKLSASAVTALRKDYLETYRRTLADKLRKLAQEKAEHDADQVIEKMFKEQPHAECPDQP